MRRGIVIGSVVGALAIALARAPQGFTERWVTEALGWLGLAGLLVSAAYSARRRGLLATNAPLSRWLNWHLILGALTLYLAALHVSLGSPGGLSGLRHGYGGWGFALTALVVVSGVLGWLLYRWAPAQLEARRRRLIQDADLLDEAADELLSHAPKSTQKAASKKAWLVETADVPSASDDDGLVVAQRLRSAARGWREDGASQGPLRPLFDGFAAVHVVTTLLALGMLGAHVVDVERASLPGLPGQARAEARSEACGQCHADHVREWRMSPHSRAGTSPLTVAMNRAAALDILAQLEEEAARSEGDEPDRPAGSRDDSGDSDEAVARREGVRADVGDHSPDGLRDLSLWEVPEARLEEAHLALGDTCMGCHAPLAAGSADGAGPIAMLSDSLLISEVGDGVGCVACHTERVHERARVHAGQLGAPIRLGPDWKVFGPLMSQDALRLNDYHVTRGFPDDKSALCRACHDVTIDRRPLGPVVRLQTTYSEWARSRYAEEGQTCVTCHMPARFATAPENVPAGPLEVRRTDHRFEGPDIDFWSNGVGQSRLDRGPESNGVAPGRAADAGRLHSAVRLELDAQPPIRPGDVVTATVRIVNTGTGHDFPSGFIFEREVWVELRATTSVGEVLFESGQTDQHGMLFDELNPAVRSDSGLRDEYLVNLRGRMLDLEAIPEAWLQEDGTVAVPLEAVDRRNLNGTPVLDSASRLRETFLQTRADAVLSASIPPDGVREARYPVPTDGLRVGEEVTIRARLLYRQMPPWVVMSVLDRLDLALELPVQVVAEKEVVHTVGGP